MPLTSLWLSQSQNTDVQYCDAQLRGKPERLLNFSQGVENWELNTGQEVGFATFSSRLFPLGFISSLTIKWNKYYTTHPYWGFYFREANFLFKLLEI